MVSQFLLLLLFASQQVPQARQAIPIQEQDKTGTDAQKSAQPQQPASPTSITIDKPVTVINQEDPKNEQRESDQRAQTRFSNGVQVWTLIFVGIAAIGAIGAYLANRREANAAEKQIELLKEQIADAKVDAIEQRRIAIDALTETRKSADAAKTSVDLVINKERARIIVQPGYFSDIEITSSYAVQGKHHIICQFPLTVYNYGATGASIASARFSLIERPTLDAPFFKNYRQVGGGIQRIELPTFIEKTIDGLTVQLSSEYKDVNWESVNAGHSHLFLVGLITYSDVFERKRETPFFYHWRGMEFPDELKGRIAPFGHWEKCGEPEDNQAT